MANVSRGARRPRVTGLAPRIVPFRFLTQLGIDRRPVMTNPRRSQEGQGLPKSHDVRLTLSGESMVSPIQAVFRGVLDQNRKVVPYPAGIERSVLLLDDVFDVLAWDRQVLTGEPVHNPRKRTTRPINPADTGLQPAQAILWA
ncbi:hypothetical protein GCM10007170_08320 [Arthrobacter liuii]|uniref:Uncharacterized protein n=1 Tax=Arthrobacter liuii TaxID=1476996 RepID=A0ABQ2AIG0_9MICC|nr:hypothetical protein GCM10007170_08320 [Arthrobacter liuii]